MSNRTRGRPRSGYLPDAERRPALQRIKERHRLLAKYVAAGLTRNEVAARMDMTPERVGQLMLDPAMQNLITQLREDPQVQEMNGFGDLDLLHRLSAHNATRAAMAMRDALDYYEDADEKMPVRESAKIFELSADRIGFGKHTHNTNVNIDFAAQLDIAIDQSRKAKLLSSGAHLKVVSAEGSATRLEGGARAPCPVSLAPPLLSEPDPPLPSKIDRRF